MTKKEKKQVDNEGQTQFVKEYMLRFEFAIALIVLAVGLGAVRRADESLSKIKIKGEWFVDQDGRVIIFHGINVVAKQFPW